ncbi:L-serine ammonia-lyase, iron-sulfur-dependent, subunit alpha [Sporomusa sphaeroides]|uniref:L-serine dehydratase n=1 Tax=Sporomusa sphaeroides DSM 2875 TaxID=1337886 RepID=A0ABP2C0E4_9FIRM|nr:L-serine ammonia-lyase, iron-sulfur-dependent, subunit alpha [Sporomusa sphaeroides]OLS57958.1 L-serine dehydratase, alpha chain [Sporomusa sphaeroides DSM 2875]CVK17855.1 L-serine dehydratase, alpha chain [Sporomusa sphaeroides DSM 2875]
MSLAKLSLAEWITAAEAEALPFAEFCLGLQVKQTELSSAEITARMEAMLAVMEESIAAGLKGPRSKGGLVGGDARKLQQYSQSRQKTLMGRFSGKAVAYALAVGEANAAMGRIVAAPTAGSSGVLPGILFALKEEYDLDQIQLAGGLIVAGAIGMVIASRASLAGAAGGCQAECGSAGAMAAGAMVALLGGTAAQVGQAVAITIKNMLGLVCDPVAGLVEVPCVKRNAGAVAQAIIAAEMALAGITSVIPVDEVIDAMESVGRSMHCSLKETAQGGLAVTPTGLELTEKISAR